MPSRRKSPRVPPARTKQKTVSIVAPMELIDWIDQYAREHSVTRSKMMRELLLEAVVQHDEAEELERKIRQEMAGGDLDDRFEAAMHALAERD